jgi:type I restriction enzyme S subunit
LTGQKYLNSSNFKKLRVPNVDHEKVDAITLLMRSIVTKETEAVKKIEEAQQLFYTRIGIDFKSIAKENTFSVSKNDFAEADLWTPMYSYPLYVNTLKTIQSKWKTINIGAIAELKKGHEVGSDAYIGYLDKHKTDVPFVRTSDIVNYEIDQYPDFFIPKEIYEELGQDIMAGDILFTNDGKIGQVGIVTEYDKFILQSHIKRIRLNNSAKRLGLSPEYVFLALTIKEIGIYQAKRYTVIQSTIPTMANNLLKVEIPILDKSTIAEITDLVKQAFKLKDEKKQLIADVRETMDGYFKV